MNTGTRHYWHGQLVRPARKPGHLVTVRFLPAASTPTRGEASIEEQLVSARATADGYRRRAEMAGRPVRQIQLAKFAESWEAKARELDARLLQQRQQPELFEGGPLP